VYLTRHETGIFRIEVRVDLHGYLLIVHLVKKGGIFYNVTSKTEKNKQWNKELSRQTPQLKGVLRILLHCTNTGMSPEAMKLNTLLQICFVAEYL
jgi:hypothetical protein